MLKRIILSGLLLIVLGTTQINAQDFTIDDNGIVKCEGADTGDTDVLFGDTYTAVDRDTLEQLIDSESDLTILCTSLITDMRYLFSGAEVFNQDIGSWDVSSVTDMRSMFKEAESFNQDINNWDISSVASLGGMFKQAISFNQNINDWDVSSVTSMNSMFEGARNFNQPLNNWNAPLDAAAFVPTSKLDLKEHQPDYVSLSFDTMFGYPTGIGCLLIHKEAFSKLEKKWIVGGTVKLASSIAPFHFLMDTYERFENGT